MKIVTIRIQIPFKSAGNNILQKEVSFNVYKQGEIFNVIPLLNESEIRLANLPPEMKFEYKDSVLISLHGKNDGNLHVLQAIGAELRNKNF